jgi:hypothetical protein
MQVEKGEVAGEENAFVGKVEEGVALCAPTTVRLEVDGAT